MHDVDSFLTTWANAERDGDAATTERRLSNDFVGVGPVGFQLTRPARLQRQTSGDLDDDELRLDEIATRPYDECAGTTARWNARGNAHGHPIPEATRITLITIEDHGDLRLAGIHFSFLAGTPGAPAPA
jgi:hypothetical protein